ncbi:MAG: bifunctional folylpolyglutamate synthase/dihydrofolate synthase [Trueperaceae bacterium]
MGDGASPATDTENDAGYLAATDWLTRQRRAGRPRDPRVARRLLDALGAPDPPRVLHVVGTNGKGTVAHLLDAMARAQGLRSGRFTSPHVEDLRERIAIGGEPIGAGEVTDFVARVRPLGRDGIGFFEWTLALAVDAFHRHGVELAVVEAGVGARADATMALPGVIGTVLTNVDLDHVETIGPTLLDVARDKAAVARPGVPLVTGARGEALALVRDVAAGVGAPVWVVDAAQPLARWPDGAPTIDASWPPTRVENARTALTLGRLLGWDEAALARGLASPPPPARFERFRLLVDGRPLLAVLDGAHDPPAAARLADALPAGYALVFASLARKRGLDTLEPLRARAGSVWLTSAEPGEDPPPAPTGPGPATHAEPAVEAALAAAARDAVARGAPLVVAGSLHLAGHARPWLRRSASASATADANQGAMLAGRWDASGSSA